MCIRDRRKSKVSTAYPFSADSRAIEYQLLWSAGYMWDKINTVSPEPKRYPESSTPSSLEDNPGGILRRLRRTPAGTDPQSHRQERHGNEHQERPVNTNPLLHDPLPHDPLAPDHRTSGSKKSLHLE